MKEYDYKCSKCDKRVTLEAGRKPRWHCGKRMIRLYPIPPIHFKGKGFYKSEEK